MPELPEVEVTRLRIAEHLPATVVQGVRLGKPLRWPLQAEAGQLVGMRVLGVRRRGKYLLIDLDGGVLLVHLGMSGSLRWAPALPPPGPHDHFDLCTSGGVLRLHDPRRFGAVVFAASEAAPSAQRLLGRLGVEPLSEAFDALRWHAQLRQRRAPIKQVLLAGDLVVGVGNIYASEALFRAGIRPTLRADRLSRPRTARLHAAIREVLQRAVAVGGSSLRDFADPQGDSGYFQLETMVYGRAGEPCRVCATPIRLLRQGQRATFFCPQCQRA
jgi:formamidopyrimidine-DNA glycosylase